MSSNHICPNCETVGMSIFYELQDVPVHSVLLQNSRDAALNYPKGDILLAFCETCGFITNIAFDPNLQKYSSGYEATQSFSPTFNEFHHRLANRLVETYKLYGKDILEIGCGQGEFLTILCELGDNNGIGFDPAYEIGSSKDPRINIIKDFYSDKYSNIQTDFICCKMTLEHIDKTAEFLNMIRRSIGVQNETIVFFQVPDMTRVLQECAFWDIYYEHCSYFFPGSFSYLFQSNGFEVLNLTKEYNDQYLMIESRPTIVPESIIDCKKDTDKCRELVQSFSRRSSGIINHWHTYIKNKFNQGKKLVVWGAGSKGVAFLSTLHIYEEIEFAVDINPNKIWSYLAGTGQKIVSPEFLVDYQPDIILLMNSVYRTEVEQKLQSLGIPGEIVAIE